MGGSGGSVGSGASGGVGGMAGAGGDGGSGGMGGLEDRGVVVRYFLDAADSGEIPAVAADSVNGVDMTIDFRDGLSWTQGPAGRGLRWPSDDMPGGAHVPCQGTAVEAMLDEHPEGTIEVVTEIEQGGMAGRLLTLASGAVDQFSLGVLEDTGLFGDHDGGDPAMEFGVELSQLGRVVLHMVYDDSAPEPMRLFIDGAEVMGNQVGPLSGNIDVPSNAVLSIGNRDNGSDSIAGAIYYAALYSVALTQPEISNNVALLAAGDDAP